MTFRDLPGYPSYVDQCAYGAVLPDENGVPTPIKKPIATYFHFTSEQMAIALERTCDGSHYHLPIEGSSPGVGNRAKASGAYQEPLCVAIAEAWDELYSEPTVDKYYMADEDENVYVEEGEDGEEEYGGQPYDDDELDYEPSIAPAEGEAPHEPEPPDPRGVLYRLTSIRQQEVKRTLLPTTSEPGTSHQCGTRQDPREQERVPWACGGSPDSWVPSLPPPPTSKQCAGIIHSEDDYLQWSSTGWHFVGGASWQHPSRPNPYDVRLHDKVDFSSPIGNRGFRGIHQECRERMDPVVWPHEGPPSGWAPCLVVREGEELVLWERHWTVDFTRTEPFKAGYFGTSSSGDQEGSHPLHDGQPKYWNACPWICGASYQTTWYRKSIGIPMFEAIRQCNGLWDTHLTFLDCWWRKRLATTQPNWILPNNLWKKLRLQQSALKANVWGRFR